MLRAVSPLLTKTRQLEIQLQHLVFDFYGLTPEEVWLMRSIAPPRDSLALAERTALAPLTKQAVDA